ncbi:MAG: hypothetical protein NC201_02460 [Prevotella sp.]|nr:hypothetical protein [Bacteroides sp.]MCM1366089.1 hypothetical protein [Prevotella sp.]MCM1436574.1 hypothetical protein [Prevotella sp.]
MKKTILLLVAALMIAPVVNAQNNKRKASSSQFSEALKAIKGSQVSIVPPSNQNIVSAESRAEGISFLKNLATTINSTLPSDMGNGMSMTSVYFRQSPIGFVYEFTLDSSIYPYSIFKDMGNAENKQSFLDSYVKGNVNEAIKALEACSCPMETVYKFTGNSNKVTVSFSPQELRMAYDKEHGIVESKVNNNSSATSVTSGNNDYSTVDFFINSSQSSLPLMVDQYTEWIKLERKGNKVYYYYLVDDKVIPINDVLGQGIKINVKNSMKNNSSVKIFAQTLVDADCTLIYNYKGRTNGKEINVVFTPSEMKEAMK